jgi:hypothetical protein
LERFLAKHCRPFTVEAVFRQNLGSIKVLVSRLFMQYSSGFQALYRLCISTIEVIEEGFR